MIVGRQTGMIKAFGFTRSVKKFFFEIFGEVLFPIFVPKIANKKEELDG